MPVRSSVRVLLRNRMVRISTLLCLGVMTCVAGVRPAQADGKSALPPGVGEFKMTKPVQTFSPGTLENHIDGQAESVKKYDFKQCDYAEYAPGGKGSQLITVDIYTMGSPLDSYGYYSYQLYPSASRVKIIKVGSVGGYQTSDSVNFWKGPYYVVVTITAANSPPAYQAEAPKIAAAIAAKLPGAQPQPPMLSLLPPGRTPHSEHYQRADLFSQAFLKNGVVANYPTAGTQAELFVAQYPSADAAKQAYGQYQAYLTKPATAAAGAKAEMPKGLGDSAVAVKTKFGGQVVAAIKGKTIAAVRKAKDPVSAQSLVKAALAKAQ